MEQIGYSLIDENDVEIAHWGDQPGTSTSLPPRIDLPNGDQVHAPALGVVYGVCRLVPRMWDYGPSVLPPTFDGTNVVVTDALANLQSTLLVRVDTDAERERRRYITPGAGQAMTYQEKHAQALAVFEMGEEAASALTPEQQAADFNVLASGIGLDAPTLWGCSQIVIAMAEQWADIAGDIERARRLGKKSISDASDAASAKAAYEAITWPNP